MRSTTRHLISASTALAAVVVLSACADSDTGGSMNGMNHGRSSASSPPRGTAAGQMGDVMFAQMMIPHHEQAIEMADLALRKEAAPSVTRLAGQIRAAQGPEIQTMKQWLSAWNAPMAAGAAGAHGGHSDGMMSDSDLRELAEAQGETFDRLWLTMMIEHHDGAIVVAREVLRTTTNPEVRSMAQAIVSAQTTEIATMRDLL